MSFLSKSLEAIKPSPTLAITKQAANLRRQGVDIISLSQGEPDFPTPDHINVAAKHAIDNGLTKYTDVDGTPELKAAVARKFERDNGLSYDLREIIVGTGGKQVIYNALLATLNPGDEVIIPAPYWVSYPDMVRLAGGVPVEVLCPEEQDFKITASQLKSAISNRTKWLILNSPSNPTGAGYTRPELEAIAAVLLEHPQVYVMTDDMYEHIRYDDWTFCTIANVVPALKDQVLTINGVSKAYAMTGWRIGYAGGPQSLIEAMAKIQSQSTSNPCSIAQAAAAAALDGPMDFLAERNRVFQQRRDLCLGAFNSIDGLSCRKPEGAFYLFPSCQGLIGRKTADDQVLRNDLDVSRFLLESARVAVVPGSAFGMEGYFRISFATSTERLEEACRRIRTACAQLN
ncbi:pyridoxal phosphate-dependent aminotransferase [Vogesella indigofera]|uniref:pyridoxal phosphate-dependent aminotransferase n=1 Tax=Vogesella indigofera TaxID=45465 RepID=UPI00234F8151|nr:pyridoxal phosphate-dependent aminotransferase [Vogesella indigofera]MDC7712364.1 pyridoxal phosphate-dependent aminotransferase [Vogesella indigofera]